MHLPSVEGKGHRGEKGQVGGRGEGGSDQGSHGEWGRGAGVIEASVDCHRVPCCFSFYL